MLSALSTTHPPISCAQDQIGRATPLDVDVFVVLFYVFVLLLRGCCCSTGNWMGKQHKKAAHAATAAWNENKADQVMVF